MDIAEANWDTAAEDAWSAYESAMSAADAAWDLAEAAAWAGFETAVAAAETAWDNAEAAAWAQFETALSDAEADWVTAEANAWAAYSGALVTALAMAPPANTAEDGTSPPAAGGDSDRQAVQQAIVDPAVRKELADLFRLIDKAEAKTPTLDKVMGPCGTFAAALDALLPKGDKAFRHVTVVPHQAAVFPAQWTTQLASPFYGYADYHEYFEVTVRVPDPEICGRFLTESTFYIDAGTHLNGNLTSNAGGNDNIFFGPLPGYLHPVPPGMDYFEWDDIIRGVK